MDALAVDSLRRCALFAHVDDPGLTTLAGLMRPRRFRRNEVIFHQDDIGDSLHIVVEGGVKIVLPSQEGDEAIIASLKPGDFFGELALLDGAPRSTTATALEATLDVWIQTQRAKARAGKLTPTRRHILDQTVPGWNTTRASLRSG